MATIITVSSIFGILNIFTQDAESLMFRSLLQFQRNKRTSVSHALIGRHSLELNIFGGCLNS